MQTFQLQLNSVTEMRDVLLQLEGLSGSELDKNVFHVYLQGFKLLMETFQQKMPKVQMLGIWFDRYANVLNLLPPMDQYAYSSFFKTIPAAITYAICCTAHKTFQVPDFHYNILKRIHKLLITISPAVLEKIMQRQADIILYLLHIVKFVADYQSQCLCLLIMKLLLEFVNDAKFNELMEQIDIVGHTELMNLMQIQLSIFDNLCRQFLNNFNKQAKEHNMVLSFCCNCIDFGENTVFYKPLKADKFWVDLNYRSSTLSFEGRCRTTIKSYEVVQIRLKIMHIEINDDDQSLSIKYVPPLESFHPNVKLHFLQTNVAKICINKDEFHMLFLRKDLIMKFNQNSKEESSNHLAPNFSVSTGYNFKLPYYDDGKKDSKSDIVGQRSATPCNDLERSKSSKLKSKPIRSRPSAVVLIESSDEETAKQSNKRTKKLQPTKNKKRSKKVFEPLDNTTTKQSASTNAISSISNVPETINIDAKEIKTEPNSTQGNKIITWTSQAEKSLPEMCVSTTSIAPKNDTPANAVSSISLYESTELETTESFPGYRFFKTHRIKTTTQFQTPSMPAGTRLSQNPQLKRRKVDDVYEVPSDDSEDDTPCTSYAAAQKQKLQIKKSKLTVDHLAFIDETF